jgi:hypothetical protein
VELEGRVLAGLLGEHGQDRRLGDEAADEAQRLGRDPGPPPSPLVEVDRLDDGPGELAEPIPESHLVEGINAAGLQPVAAEGALKVGVPLQQRDLHPAAGKQVGESRSRRPRPDDDHTSDRHDAAPFSLGTSTVPTLLANAEDQLPGRLWSLGKAQCLMPARSNASVRSAWLTSPNLTPDPFVSSIRAI